MITWRPIAELPEELKDGREVLFWRDILEAHTVTWNDHQQCWGNMDEARRDRLEFQRRDTAPISWEPERGFYWLKLKEQNRTVRRPDPTVAWFDGERWNFPGTDFVFDPTDDEDREVLDQYVIIGRAEPPIAAKARQG